MRLEISACGVSSAGMTSRRTLGIAQRSLAALLGALLLIGSSVALASPALAQATRTWVSGVGDDANPCSRTAPCKTFAGAIGKTAIGGEINALDSGGFGAVTITKSITIDASSVHGGILVSGTNGVVVNAGPTDDVILRGLDFFGVGTGLDGVRVVSARSVSIEDSTFARFSGSAVNVIPSAVNTRVFIDNVQIRNMTGNGVSVAPSGGRTPKVVVNRTRIVNVSTALKVGMGGTAYLFDSTLTHSAIGLEVLLGGVVNSGDPRNRIIENGTNVVTPVQQVSGVVPTKVKVQTLAILPQLTNKGQPVTWTSKRPGKCVIQGTRVKGIALGICTIHAASPATATLLGLSQNYLVTVTK